jgi:hypothetical protein
MCTSPLHREHIALHEIGHLLAGHQGQVGVEDIAGLLLPDLNPALVRAVLKRTCYSSEQEWEAEYFATLVLERSRSGRDGRRIGAADPALVGVLGRLEDTWGRAELRRAQPTAEAIPPARTGSNVRGPRP